MKPANQIESQYSGQRTCMAISVGTQAWSPFSTLGIASCIRLRYVSCMVFLIRLSMQYAKRSLCCVVELNCVHNDRKEDEMALHCTALCM
jgi:hypothetical protein